jgi:mannose-6-phosphate isomerase-like protein (cupin superfamily)
MTEELAISPGASLRVLSRTDQELVLEARYAAGGSPPPAHFHPAQDERFEVLAGAMRARIDGRESELDAGDVIEVPRGTAHQFWNPGEEEAAVRWITLPAGRTLEFFRELAGAGSGSGEGDPATLLERYADTFRLAGA